MYIHISQGHRGRYRTIKHTNLLCPGFGRPLITPAVLAIQCFMRTGHILTTV